jgi:hypothetical protein
LPQSRVITKTNAGNDVAKQEPYTLLVGMQISIITVESSMEIPQKKYRRTTIYTTECKTGYSRDTCTPVFITAKFTRAKLWKQCSCPTTDEWIKKLWYIYTMSITQP